MKIDHRENVLMLREMSIFNPKCIIAIDGMNCSSEPFRNKRSWGPEGLPQYVSQFVINGEEWSVITAYTYDGFIEWQPIKRSTTASDMRDFLKFRLSRRDLPGNVGFLDNASVNRTDEVRQSLDDTFQGLWRNNGKYSPYLSPVERDMSNVCSYITARENMRMRPIDLINEALHYYSVEITSGRAAAPGNWNTFVNNHNHYLTSGLN